MHHKGKDHITNGIVPVRFSSYTQGQLIERVARAGSGQGGHIFFPAVQCNHYSSFIVFAIVTNKKIRIEPFERRKVIV